MKFLETGNKYKTNKIQISYKHDRNQSKIQNKNNRNKIQIQMVAADKIADCKVWMKYCIDIRIWHLANTMSQVSIDGSILYQQGSREGCMKTVDSLENGECSSLSFNY